MSSLGLVVYELPSLVDLSHDTLYEHNTTTLNAERLKVADDLAGLPSHFAELVPVLRCILQPEPFWRANATDRVRSLDEMIANVPWLGMAMCPCGFAGFSLMLLLQQRLRSVPGCPKFHKPAHSIAPGGRV